MIPTLEQWKDIVSRISPTKTFYGTCSTASTTKNKVVSCPQFKSSDLKISTQILITMTKSQEAGTPITLNINNTGAQAFSMYQDKSDSDNAWEAGETISCVYDGLGWLFVGDRAPQPMTSEEFEAAWEAAKNNG